MSRIRIACASVLLVGIAACSRDDAATARTTSGTVAVSRADAAIASPIPAALETSEDPADVELAATLRQALVADDTLSMTARNVTIVTSGGRVSLRGDVKNQREHDTVVAKARELAGRDKVEDRLTIETR